MDRMTAFSRERLTTFLRGIGLRQVRIVSGVYAPAPALSYESRYVRPVAPSTYHWVL